MTRSARWSGVGIFEHLKVGVHGQEHLVEGRQVADSLRLVVCGFQHLLADSALRSLGQPGDQHVFGTEVVCW